MIRQTTKERFMDLILEFGPDEFLEAVSLSMMDFDWKSKEAEELAAKCSWQIWKTRMFYVDQCHKNTGS